MTITLILDNTFLRLIEHIRDLRRISRYLPHSLATHIAKALVNKTIAILFF